MQEHLEIMSRYKFRDILTIKNIKAGPRAGLRGRMGKSISVLSITTPFLRAHVQ